MYLSVFPTGIDKVIFIYISFKLFLHRCTCYLYVYKPKTLNLIEQDPMNAKMAAIQERASKMKLSWRDPYLLTKETNCSQWMQSSRTEPAASRWEWPKCEVWQLVKIRNLRKNLRGGVPLPGTDRFAIVVTQYGWRTSAILRGNQGLCLWSGRRVWFSPFSRKGTRGCVPITGGSHSSAS